MSSVCRNMSTRGEEQQSLQVGNLMGNMAINYRMYPKCQASAIFSSSTNRWKHSSRTNFSSFATRPFATTRCQLPKTTPPILARLSCTAMTSTHCARQVGVRSPTAVFIRACTRQHVLALYSGHVHASREYTDNHHPVSGRTILFLTRSRRPTSDSSTVKLCQD